MQKHAFAVVAVVLAAAFATPVMAQGARQTATIEHVDVEKIAAGYRASKILGSSVVNDANEVIGTIDDLLVEPNNKRPFAVLSVGGFLGLGDRLVVVTFESLKVTREKIVLAGGSKEALKALPDFRYASK